MGDWGELEQFAFCRVIKFSVKNPKWQMCKGWFSRQSRIVLRKTMRSGGKHLGAIKLQSNHLSRTTNGHQWTRIFNHKTHKTHQNASQTSALVLMILRRYDMVYYWRSRWPPSARRLSSLREVQRKSCGSSESIINWLLAISTTAGGCRWFEWRFA